MSMQKIREYMEKNPEEGKELRRMNKSYVFFRETDLTEFDEAIGAQGISLTAARSIRMSETGASRTSCDACRSVQRWPAGPFQ